MGLNEKFFRSATDEDEGFFNTVIYDGQEDDLSVTGVGFTPDLVWIKCRDVNATSHSLVDSVRGGDGTRMYALFPDLVSSESSFNAVEKIDSDGFTVFGDKAATNRANRDYVAWCWKAGGAAVSNTNGDLNSNVSANVANGFSIVKGIGGSTSGGVQSVGHGLDSAPELVLIKNINSTDNWPCLVPGLTSSNYYMRLNTIDGEINNTTPTIFADSTTVSIRQNSFGAWGDLIAYCFHSVAGVSKVGSYTGANSSVVVPTGFEPAFVMIKFTSGTIGYGGWFIYDNKRDTTNPVSVFLQANSALSELDNSSYSISFNSTGFTVGSTQNDGINYNNNEYIYYAIA